MSCINLWGRRPVPEKGKCIDDLQTRRLSTQPITLIFEMLPMQTETDYIPDVYRALIEQLLGRGLMPAEIEELVRDALNVLCRGGIFTMLHTLEVSP